MVEPLAAHVSTLLLNRYFLYLYDPNRAHGGHDGRHGARDGDRDDRALGTIHLLPLVSIFSAKQDVSYQFASNLNSSFNMVKCLSLRSFVQSHSPSFHTNFLSGICSTLWPIFHVCCHELTHSNFFKKQIKRYFFHLINEIKSNRHLNVRFEFGGTLTLLGTQINFFSVRHICCQASFHANFLSSNQICFFSVRLRNEHDLHYYSPFHTYIKLNI